MKKKLLIFITLHAIFVNIYISKYKKSTIIILLNIESWKQLMHSKL